MWLCVKVYNCNQSKTEQLHFGGENGQTVPVSLPGTIGEIICYKLLKTLRYLGTRRTSKNSHTNLMSEIC